MPSAGESSVLFAACLDRDDVYSATTNSRLGNVAHLLRRSHPNERTYTPPVALDVEVQRLQIGDVILVEISDSSTEVEAKVVREIDRTEGSVRATLRVAGRDDFIEEWPLGELVTLVRGP
jgi:hypothetical protein